MQRHKAADKTQVPEVPAAPDEKFIREKDAAFYT